MGEIWVGYEEKVFHQKVVWAWEQAPQESGHSLPVSVAW